MQPPLPFEPQPLVVAQSRYPAALSRTWPWVDSSTYSGDAPSYHRDHVFDFEDGVRLVVAKVKTRSGDVVVLVSAVMTMPLAVGRMDADSLAERYFDLAQQRYGGEILGHGMTAEGRVAWWLVKAGGCPRVIACPEHPARVKE